MSKQLLTTLPGTKLYRIFLETTSPSQSTAPSITSTSSVIFSNVDLVFMIDSSYLLGGSNYWQQVIDLMINIIDGLTIGPSNTQVGLVVIGWPATSKFYLNSYLNKSTLISAIQVLQYTPQWTHLAYGLQEINANQFTLSHGDRSNYPNVAIVILATVADQGQSDTLTKAEAAWNAGIKIYAVGVTNKVNEKELASISSLPHQLNENYFVVEKFAAISNLTMPLLHQILSLSGECIIIIVFCS